MPRARRAIAARSSFQSAHTSGSTELRRAPQPAAEDLWAPPRRLFLRYAMQGHLPVELRIQARRDSIAFYMHFCIIGPTMLLYISACDVVTRFCLPQPPSSPPRLPPEAFSILAFFVVLRRHALHLLLPSKTKVTAISRAHARPSPPHMNRARKMSAADFQQRHVVMTANTFSAL